MSTLVNHCDRCKTESAFGQSSACVYRAVHGGDGLAFWIVETDPGLMDEVKFWEGVIHVL